MESKQEPRTARVWIIALLIAFAILALGVAAYYYTFHGYKKQQPAVAPAATIVLLEANKMGPGVESHCERESYCCGVPVFDPVDILPLLVQLSEIISTLLTSKLFPALMPVEVCDPAAAAPQAPCSATV